MFSCTGRTFRSPRSSLCGANLERAADLLAGHHFMPCRAPVTLSPERSAAILEEALRRIEAAIPDRAVDLCALRKALETEMAKGPVPLVKLMKVGRRRAIDRLCRMASKGVNGSCNSHGTPAHLARCRRPRNKATTMATGTVKWFNPEKGFGFIQPDDGKQDVFVHISAVQRAGMNNLNEGQKLSYEMVADKRSGKMSADNLQAE